MSYLPYHSAWSGSHLLSGAAWNHFESQWTAIKADVDAHTHDTRYYPKATADTTFFSASYYSGFDADLLDGQHLSGIVSTIMPIGAILVWSGTDATIPSGWHICDGGTYGGYVSPDLRDRFVIGAGGSYAVNATGGPATWNGTITPTGAVTVGNHILTTAEIPSHTHDYSAIENNKDRMASANPIYSNSMSLYAGTHDFAEQNEGGGGSHGHPGSSATFSAIDPRPPYYALYYIMKYA